MNFMCTCVPLGFAQLLCFVVTKFTITVLGSCAFLLVITRGHGLFVMYATQLTLLEIAFWIYLLPYALLELSLCGKFPTHIQNY